MATERPRARKLCALLLGVSAHLGCHHLQPPPVTLPPSPTVCPPVCPDAPPHVTDKPPAPQPWDPQPIDLPTALKLADTQNPEIAVARQRIQEAFAAQNRAEVLWLPDLEFGSTWTRHDGQIQRSTGEVITVSRSSLFVGGGPVMSLDIANAYFAPLAARQITAARAAGAAATTNDRLLEVALTYTDLLQVYAELEINLETLHNAETMLSITEELEKVGKGAAADTARSRTEVRLRQRERVEIEGRIGATAAHLAQLLLLPPEAALRPAEPALVPIALVPEQVHLEELIAQGLLNRPELAENRALIAAALERWRAAKTTPFIPSLRLSYAAGGFGGGVNSFFGDFSGRHDFSASLIWELQNFGLGNAAITRERQAQHAVVTLRQSAIQADVAREVVEAFRIAFAQRLGMLPAQEAVEAARASYRLNEERVRRAPDVGRPIELLQAVQALNRARLDYLQVVADYNRAQFRLYTAMGNPPLCALDAAVAVATKEPTVPPPAEGERLPEPRKEEAGK